jgi:signal transduction histidine kinase
VNRWFQSLPISRKLVTIAVAVSVIALIAATTGLVLFDLVRYRSAAADATRAYAQIVADNISAAINFGDVDAGQVMVDSLRVRPTIALVCVYRADGVVFTHYARNPGEPCPRRAFNDTTWTSISMMVPVVRNDTTVGTIYVRRTLADMRDRIIATVAGGLAMMLLAGVLAFGLASRLQRIISRPIVQLADAARRIGGDATAALPHIEAAPDETGQLVRAFGDMMQRISAASAEREGLLAREREASRLKDEFLASVSHELRTPLNAILGWTQILTRSEPTKEVLDKAIASLARSAQAQNRVIDDLLDVSRVIGGKMQVKFSPVDLRTVVDAAVDVVAPIAGAKRIALEADVPASECLVNGDFARLRQILWNLLSNAVKFTPAGGDVKVRIQPEGPMWTLSVTDTGVGVPASFIGQAFERFRQADSSSGREYGGLGLGLAIVKELTELHGGHVRAFSEGPNRGATFTVLLPRLDGSGGTDRT